MAERKLLLDEREGSVTATVGQEGCDPHSKVFEGTLEEVLPAVPDFLTEAQEQWAVSPKNPAFKPPTTPKATPAAAKATPAQPPKAEDLPLLSGTETAAPAEEKVAEAPSEVTEVPAAPAETEPEAAAPPAETVAVEPVEGATEEEKAEDVQTVEQDLSERIAQAPAPPAAEPGPSAPAKPGEWEYYLQDGRGPYGTVQLAMDALGLDVNTRPGHNRWDRLSTAMKEKIQRRPKA